MIVDYLHRVQHEGLSMHEVDVNRIRAFAHALARARSDPNPARAAERATLSHRIKQATAWRSHLLYVHGTQNLPPWASLARLQALHEEEHNH